MEHGDEDLIMCDFAGHDHEGDCVLMGPSGPVAVVCTDAMEQIQSKTHDSSHKVSLDIHFHRHVIVDLVDSTDPKVMGEQYMAGKQAVS